MTWDQIVPIVVSVLSVLGMGGIISGAVLRRIGKMDKKADQSEAERKRESKLIIGGLMALGDLSESTATAIKNGRCNGETTAALEKYGAYREKLDDWLVDGRAEGKGV